MLLCNLSLVLLSKMFHQISCSRKQVDINHRSVLGSVRSAFLAKDEGTLYSFKNEVPYLVYDNEINRTLKEMAIAVSFQSITFCDCSAVCEKLDF